MLMMARAWANPEQLMLMMLAAILQHEKQPVMKSIEGECAGKASRLALRRPAYLFICQCRATSWESRDVECEVQSAGSKKI